MHKNIYHFCTRTIQILGGNYRLLLEYKNLYYSSTSNTETVESYMHKYERDKLVPGFTMSMRTRPLVIAKMIELRVMSHNLSS